MLALHRPFGARASSDPRFDFRKGFITHGAMVIFCEILSQPNEDSDRHVEDGTSPDAIGVEETFADPSIDDWNLDFNLPESRLFGGWESNQPWGLRI